MAAPIELHGFAQCPFAWRTRLVATEKGVPFVYVAFDATPPDPRAVRNPDRRSPLLVDGDYRLTESGVIAQYLDEAYEGPLLQPEDPRDRAAMRLAIAEIKLEVDFRPGVVATPEARERVVAGLRALDARLVDGRDWIGGAEPSLADLIQWPFLAGITWRLGIEIPAELPRVRAYWDRVQARPSFAATTPAGLRA